MTCHETSLLQVDVCIINWKRRPNLANAFGAHDLNRDIQHRSTFWTPIAESWYTSRSECIFFVRLQSHPGFLCLFCCTKKRTTYRTLVIVKCSIEVHLSSRKEFRIIQCRCRHDVDRRSSWTSKIQIRRCFTPATGRL